MIIPLVRNPRQNMEHERVPKTDLPVETKTTLVLKPVPGIVYRGAACVLAHSDPFLCLGCDIGCLRFVVQQQYGTAVQKQPASQSGIKRITLDSTRHHGLQTPLTPRLPKQLSRTATAQYVYT